MTSSQAGDAAFATSPPYSHLQAVLAAGEFAVTCELGPPRAPDAADVMQEGWDHPRIRGCGQLHR